MTERVNCERVFEFLLRANGGGYSSLLIRVLCLYWVGGNGGSLRVKNFVEKIC